MSPGRLDILTEALTFVARLIMQARSDKDAEALRHQLQALGDTKRADVDAVEADARRRLRQDEPTQSTRTPIAPDFPGGPLGEGD